jgi:hypothetical protein
MLQSIGSEMSRLEVMGHQSIACDIPENISPSSNPSFHPDYSFNRVNRRRSKHDNDLLTVSSLDRFSNIAKQLGHPDPNLVARMEVIGILIIRKTLLVSLENCSASDSWRGITRGNPGKDPPLPLNPGFRFYTWTRGDIDVNGADLILRFQEAFFASAIS